MSSPRFIECFYWILFVLEGNDALLNRYNIKPADSRPTVGGVHFVLDFSWVFLSADKKYCT